MEADNSLKSQIIRMITEAKEELVAYKGLCRKFKIAQDPIPEAVTQAKLEVLEQVLKNTRT